MNFQLVSERYGRLGNDAGDAAASVVEGVGLLQHEVLLRESIQNSWDHRLVEATSPIRFRAHARILTKAQHKQMRKIFDEIPPVLAGLKKSLVSDSPLEILTIEDAGCLGLGGNLTPDDPDVSESNVGWKNFVFNSGKTPFRQIGGGFFGFGKAVFFASSLHGTCIVYTQTRLEKTGQIECRLIAKALTPATEQGTGRHWWGIADGDGGVLPILGAEAKSIANQLGISSLAADQTGTSVTVLSPNLGDLAHSNLAEALKEAAIKWAWPLMTPRQDGLPRVEFEFSQNGSALGKVDVRDHPIYGRFVGPFLAATEGPPRFGNIQVSEVTPARSREKVAIGRLAFAKSLAEPGRSATPDLANHIALMRKPLLVVAYERVNRDQIGNDVAGVFVASDPFDEIFARAEPVAHDAWKEAKLNGQGLAFNPVKLLRTYLRTQFPEFEFEVSPGEGPDAGASGAGIVANARKLGELLTGLVGTGPSGPGGGSRPRSRSPFTLKLDPRPQLQVSDADVVSVFVISAVSNSSENPDAFMLRTDVRVLIDDGNSESTDEVDEDRRPEILGWRVLETGQSLGLDIPLQRLIEETLGFAVKHRPDMGIVFSASVNEKPKVEH